jgi:copper chaperone CopZ
MQSLTLQVEGMSCGHCLNAVSQALGRLPGVTVESVRVGRAELSFDPGVTTPARIQEAVEEAGYATAVVA